MTLAVLDMPNQMPRRAIGKTGVEISVMGLGAAPLGGLYQPSSQRDADATIAAAHAAGITHIDVAPHYGRGLAEVRVGHGLGRSAADAFVLSTKVGRLLRPTAAPVPMPNFPEALPVETSYDVSARGIAQSFTDSIERLASHVPSILLLHDPDRYAEGEALRTLIATAHRALCELKIIIVVAAIGIGVNAPEACRIALEVGDWDCFLLAGRYSVLRQEDEGVLDACLARGVSVLIGAPFMSGALAGGTTWRYRPIPADVAADIAMLRALCARYGVPMEAVALQFPLRHPAVTSVVVGMRNAREVEKNAQALSTPVPDEFWHELPALGFAGGRQRGGVAS